MSIVFDILRELNSKSFNYKGSRVNFLGLPRFKSYSAVSLRGTMSSLIKKGFIEDCEGLRVTNKGKHYIKRKIDSLQQFDFKFDKNSPKNLIVMFDVPEPKKAE